MKTIITIEVETNDMLTVYEDDMCTGEPITESFEEGMHTSIKNAFKRFIKEDKFEEEYFENEDENILEGAEEFADYANVIIRLDNEEVLNIKKHEVKKDDDEDDEETEISAPESTSVPKLTAETSAPEPTIETPAPEPTTEKPVEE